MNFPFRYVSVPMRSIGQATTLASKRRMGISSAAFNTGFTRTLRLENKNLLSIHFLLKKQLIILVFFSIKSIILPSYKNNVETNFLTYYINIKGFKFQSGILSSKFSTIYPQIVDMMISYIFC